MTQHTDLADWTATDLTAAYRSGSVSPVEATRAALDRIEAHNPKVNAFRLVDPDIALEEARASQQRWSAGTPAGPVDGVPTSIKDLLLTRGWPTLRGSLSIDPDQEWPEDAPSTARLRESGAVLLGKTTTPEYGWKGTTDSPRDGVTGNAWDPSRTPGGSSGGAASAIALGMCALATGTDGGGSVRIPAGFSGIVGLKPTYGRVPLYPASPFGTLAHTGPMTWSVDDAALMLDVISRWDSRDWSALPPPEVSYTAHLREGIAGLRVAFSPGLGYVEVDAEIGRLVRSAVDVLVDLGARVEQADPGFSDPVEPFQALWFAGAAKVVEHLTPAQRDRLDPGLREACDEGAALSALDYLEAVAQRMALGVLMGRFHETYDLLVTPTLPIPAFEAGVEVPRGWPHRRWPSWTPFSYPFNLTQQPAISVPCGFTSQGLPVGLQIVGPRHADARVLAAAKAYQDAAPWLDRRPSV